MRNAVVHMLDVLYECLNSLCCVFVLVIEITQGLGQVGRGAFFDEAISKEAVRAGQRVGTLVHML